MKNLTFLFLTIVSLQSALAQKEGHSIVTGKVFNRDSKQLLLHKSTEDVRNTSTEIPISKDGLFTYNLYYKAIEQYELVFKDEFDDFKRKPIQFFSDSDTIKFELYPFHEAHHNSIRGGALNLQQSTYNQLINDRLYWYKKEDSLSRIDHVNAEQMKIVSLKIDSISAAIVQYKRNSIAKNPTIFGYSLYLSMIDQARMKETSLDTLNQYFNMLQSRYPDHPYTMIAKNKLYGLKHVVVGGKYVDFSASDKNGVTVDVSSVVSSNKLTLIDLWSPWCGPCIRKSRNVIPLYKKYSKMGFEVIGVIGGIDSHEKYQKAIKKHKYPWANLAEVNQENRIWEKYNLIRSPGDQFLVDRNGTILSINPKPEELENLLIKM